MSKKIKEEKDGSYTLTEKYNKAGGLFKTKIYADHDSICITQTDSACPDEVQFINLQDDTDIDFFINCLNELRKKIP